jgi:hypothetical protein
MAVDWVANVKKYVNSPGTSAIAGIIKYSAIALQKKEILPWYLSATKTGLHACARAS